MMKLINSILIMSFISSLFSCGGVPENAPETADEIKLEKYVGKWYELAHYPVSFQKDCYGTTAEYSIRDDGAIDVINTCYKGSLNGKKKVAEGKAIIPNEDEPQKLKVQFFWPFKGDYWILYVDEDYQYAIVGGPKREYLWILSRSPDVSEERMQKLLKIVKEKGYSTDPLVFTEHK